jgi:hypothetical protein
MQNCIYSGCIPDPWIGVSEKLLKDYCIKPVYWIGWQCYGNIRTEEELNRIFGNGSVIYHDLAVAWKAIFPLSVSNIQPVALDEEMMDEISSFELIALRMMDRLDPDRKSTFSYFTLEVVGYYQLSRDRADDKSFYTASSF